MKKAFLSVQSGSMQGQTLFIAGAPAVLGRSTDCDLVLSDYQRVSRRHARLEWQGTALVVHDENSTNGVLVDGIKVAQATLKNGSLLQLGDFSAVVSLHDALPHDALPRPAEQSGGFAVRAGQKWRDSPLSPPQKWGLVGAAAIVLSLGAAGMRRSAPPDPFEGAPNPSRVAPASSTAKIPDAPSAPPAQTAPVAAAEPVNGRISPAAIQNAKSATVLIARATSGGYAMGSGFALGDARRIITNRHVVVDESGNPRDVLLIFEAGTPRERKIEVKAERIALAPQTAGENQFQDDLAVITLDAGQTPSLPAGKSEALSETDEVYAVGFPLGVQTLTLNGDLPSASVKAARVERLQRDKNDAVSVIQLGSSVTHGNSGGPVVNNRGEVVGVISSGVEGTGMAYAIPMAFVNALPGS